MANNTIMRQVTVTDQFAPLANRSTVCSVTISCPPGNVDPVIFLGDDGSEVTWLAGEWHTFHSINLADIRIKGTPGDVVSVVGGTW